MEKGVTMDGYVSVKEAARLKRVTREAIYLAIRLGRLKACCDGRRMKVSILDLNDYDASRWDHLRHSRFKEEKLLDKKNGYVSINDAAKAIRVPMQKLYYAIRSGKIKATKRNSAWMVHVEDLLEYQRKFSKEKFTEKTA
jgi:Helix-turn-helix domain